MTERIRDYLQCIAAKESPLSRDERQFLLQLQAYFEDKLQPHEIVIPQDEWDRMQTVHKEWEHTYQNTIHRISSLACKLTVAHDIDNDWVHISDHHGYLTTVITPAQLWFIVKKQATIPGYLRERLTGINTASIDEWQKMRAITAHEEKLEEANALKSKAKQSKLSLEDLDL